MCVEGCKCDRDVDACVTRCLETRVLAADCNTRTAATPLYENWFQCSAALAC